MKKHCLINLNGYLILFGIALFPVAGSALDLAIEPRVQTGLMDYQFEQKTATRADGDRNDGDKDHGFKLLSNMAFVGVGATLFANRFFLDVYAQKAFSGSDTATREEDREVNNKVLRLNYVVDSDIERNDYSMSVGYALGSRWVVFGGYRNAKTRFTNTESLRHEFDANIFYVSQSTFSPSFKQDGYFLGSTYALPVGKRSVVTFNLALAALDGKYDSRRSEKVKGVDSEGNVLTDSDGKPIEGFEDVGAFHNGDTLGLNLGASWKGRIGERIGYSLGANGYNYDFENKSSEEGQSQADLSENVLRFSAGLSYQF
jgi:hypothetical protein